MQWLSRTPNFDFVRYRHVAMVGSGLLSLIALVALFYPGLNYGLDFTGGIIVEADSEQALADGLLALWIDPERAAALGEAGAAGVREHYTVGRMAEAAEAVYRDLAARRH